VLAWVIATALLGAPVTASPEPPCTLIGPARDAVDGFVRFTLWARDSSMVALRHEWAVADSMDTDYVDSVVSCRHVLDSILISDGPRRIHASQVSVWRIGRVYIVGVNDHEPSVFILDERFRILDQFVGLN